MLNMAMNAFYSVYGDQLEAGVVDEVLSEISKFNRQYSKECMDIHAHQVASFSSQYPDHQQPRCPFLVTWARNSPMEMMALVQFLLILLKF